MSTVVLVVQARLGSTRFPGKMLAPLGGRPLISWVLERVVRSREVADVIVATTDSPEDDPLVAAIAGYPVAVFRGSADDVLARFADALAGTDAEHVVRVCADNPFVDPDCIDALIREHIRTASEYMFNHRPHGECDYVDGLGAEIIERDVFDRLSREATRREHREHVTLAIVDGTIRAQGRGMRAPEALRHPEVRLDVDTPEDLHRLQGIVESGRLSPGSTAEEIVAAALART
jgi:spore coat polysaccharide biosynthesis protein SpsF